MRSQLINAELWYPHPPQMNLLYPQSDPPRPPGELLPTMYDLPSENIEEPGWPDQYHLWQSEFLGETFSPPNFPSEEIFVASDLNLYYNIRHPRWYKRPDWFAVPGLPRFYQQRDSRLISVIWQQGISPLIVC